jgi:hypothetical protein
MNDIKSPHGDYPSIIKAVLNNGGTHAQARKAVAQSNYASAAGTINNWYGGHCRALQ